MDTQSLDYSSCFFLIGPLQVPCGLYGGLILPQCGALCMYVSMQESR